MDCRIQKNFTAWAQCRKVISPFEITIQRVCRGQDKQQQKTKPTTTIKPAICMVIQSLSIPYFSIELAKTIEAYMELLVPRDGETRTHTLKNQKFVECIFEVCFLLLPLFDKDFSTRVKMQ